MNLIRENRWDVSMTELLEVLAKHGYWLLFASVLGRQACLPVPANLLLVAAGALAGFGRLSFLSVVVLSVTAFLLADLAWYKAGQRWGCRTLHFICGATRGAGPCVDDVTATFSRYGVKSLLVSKFIVGVDAIAAPMSGISGISLPRFLIFDALGAILWACAYTSLGYAFSNQLYSIAMYSAKIGKMVVLVGVAGLCVLIVRKLVDLHRFLSEFRLARITPDQLKSKLIAGEEVLLLDLQGGKKHCQGLMGIPGSVRIDPRLLGHYKRQHQDIDLPVNREVILYCATLGERRSARMALALQRRGFERVRPLAGGLRAWRDRGYPITRDVQVLPASEQAAFVLREIIRYSPATSAHGLNTSIANRNQLLERAQDRTASDTDTRLPFFQQCHQEEIPRVIINISSTSSLSQASEPE
jgi:membrane protein DedA with SNARE-associated domain/rhodanese-related sulfurtransferase